MGKFNVINLGILICKFTGEEINENTFYLNLERFYKKTTYRKLQKLVPVMQNYNYLIIDLRDNTGGYFKSLRNVIDLFLSKNQLVYVMKTASGEIKEEYYSQTQSELKFRKVILFTNNDTASVSELFILALKYNLNNVVVIGTPTKGKYFSYSVRRFQDGSGYRFITSIMEGPQGKQIGKEGIFPDIIVEDENKLLEIALKQLK